MNPRKITWRPFRQSDLDSIELLEEKEIVIRDAQDLHDLGESLSDDRFCGIASYGGQAILIGGWKRIDAHTLSVFIIPTKNIFNHPVIFTRIVLHWLAKMQALPGVNRILTFSVCNARIDRWMETVGFVYEKTLTQYADGRDYKLWSKRVNGS